MRTFKRTTISPAIALFLGLIVFPVLIPVASNAKKPELFNGWFGGWFDSNGYLKSVENAQSYDKPEFTDNSSGATITIPQGWKGLILHDNLVAVRAAGKMSGEMKADPHPSASNPSVKPGAGNPPQQPSSPSGQRMTEEKGHLEMDRSAFSLFSEPMGKKYRMYMESDLNAQQEAEVKSEVEQSLKDETHASRVNISDVRKESVNGRNAIVCEGTVADQMSSGKENKIYTRLYMLESGDSIVHVLYAAPETTWKQTEAFAGKHIQTLQLPGSNPPAQSYNKMRENR